MSRALALPIPLPADYVRSLPRIPKDFKVPKRVCRDIKISPGATNAGKGETFTKICKDGVGKGKGKGSGGEMMILIVLMGLCMCCCCSIISTGTGGFLWWKKRKESEK